MLLLLTGCERKSWFRSVESRKLALNGSFMKLYSELVWKINLPIISILVQCELSTTGNLPVANVSQVTLIKAQLHTVTKVAS